MKQLLREEKMFRCSGISCVIVFYVSAGSQCSAATGSGVSRRAEAGGDLQRPRPSPRRLPAAQLGASRRPRSHRLLPGRAAEDTGTMPGAVDLSVLQQSTFKTVCRASDSGL